VFGMARAQHAVELFRGGVHEVGKDSLCCCTAVAFGSAAKAGSIGTDPKLVVNNSGPSPNLFKNGMSSETVELEYTGNGNLTSLTIYVPVPPHDWNPSSNIFSEITTIFPPPHSGFLFSGGTLTPDEIIFLTVISPTAFSGTLDISNSFSCVDGCSSGGLTVSPSISATPEPSTLLMFLGLGPVIGFARKRWGAKLSA